MFSSAGLFKQIPCPKQAECTLPNCIFLHDSSSAKADTNCQAQEYDPLSIRSSPSPPPKKRRLDYSPEPIRPKPNPALAESPSVAKNVHPSNSVPVRKELVPPKPTPMTRNQTTLRQHASAQRPITPPTTSPKLMTPNSKLTPAPVKPPDVKSQYLHPRSVPRAPDILSKRMIILKGLYAQIVIQNDKVKAAGADTKSLVLSDAEMIKFAIDEEEQAAIKYENEIYRNHISQLAFRVKKLSSNDWKSFVTTNIRKIVERPKPEVGLEAGRPQTGLSSIQEETTVLRSIRTSLVGLEDYGYVLKQPTEADLTAARQTVKATAGWEKCDRCDTRFLVFPGRDDKGRLASGGVCRYHWARSTRPPNRAGNVAATYPCCNKNVGSVGCAEADSHVFKVTDKKRLATVLQFEHTPPNANPLQFPVSFDCEMGYTTLGLEVIRVTAVSWPEGKPLLDVLVRPFGEILDLNTRFSGVSIKQFTEAPEYDFATPNPVPEPTDSNGPPVLQKVSSPIAARQLLFHLISPETPLIGHAIDNDLNTLRIIHPVIIDTVLLYPHPKGLPIKYGLKTLASMHLNRHIQASGEIGHDSNEDAVATGDLVTVKVREKWKRMKGEGWGFQEGVLVAPNCVVKGTGSLGKKAIL
jgi:hypothetical protein